MNKLLLRRRNAFYDNKIAGSLVPIGNVGIACWINNERRYFTTADWKPKYKTYALGVYIDTQNTHLIISPQYISGVWSDSVWCPNVFTTDNANTAKSDYNGVYNTQCVFDAYNDNVLSQIPLFESVRSVQFLDGSEGYLPAMGELWDIMQYTSDVINYMSLLDVNWPYQTNYQSSTQRDYTNIWTAYKKDQIRYLNKSGGYNGLVVIPINNNTL